MYKTNKLYWPILFAVDMIGSVLFFWKKLKKKPENPEKILVIRLDHIGDMILTSSFTRNLKQNYPDAEITMLARKEIKEVAEMLPGVDKVEALNTPWFSRDGSDGWMNMLRYGLHNYKKYNLVFEMHIDPLNIILANTMGKYTVGYGERGFGFLLNKKVKYPKEKKHVVEMNLEMIKAIGNRIDDGRLELNISKEWEKAFLEKMKKLGLKGKKIILIHAISGRKLKNLSLDRWNEINKELLKKYKWHIIVYIGSKKDKEELDKNISFDSKKIINIAGELSLKENIAIVDQADIVISVDTFTVHAASAFGRKSIVLYGPTDAKIWGPYMNPDAKVIQGQYKGCEGCEMVECKYGERGKEGKCLGEIDVFLL